MLADIDALSSRTDALGTVLPVTTGVLVAGWAVVIWIRARRNSRDQRDAHP